MSAAGVSHITHCGDKSAHSAASGSSASFLTSPLGCYGRRQALALLYGREKLVGDFTFACGGKPIPRVSIRPSRGANGEIPAFDLHI